ncbi:unnamed protein product [Chilo suppressalis]|uniref:PHD-type domain-containing protein n=1 Tax=Chilo suppressalis TaxID=168631 RepID=A0ABN8L8C7_CHISP|nr:unnamed protein product [Chilo suppressalis]
MPNYCSACNNKVTSARKMQCSQVKCGKVYDLVCLGFKQKDFDLFTEEYKRLWVCPECVNTKPKHFDCNTPVRALDQLMITPNSESNVTIQRGCRSKQSDGLSVDFEKRFMAEIREMRLELTNRMDTQDTTIKCIKDLCYSTRQDLQEFKSDFESFLNQHSIPSNSIHTQFTALCNRFESSVNKLEYNTNHKTPDHTAGKLLTATTATDTDIIASASTLKTAEKMQRGATKSAKKFFGDASQSEHQSVNDVQNLETTRVSKKSGADLGEWKATDMRNAKHSTKTKTTNKQETRKQGKNTTENESMINEFVLTPVKEISEINNVSLRSEKIQSTEVKRGKNTELVNIKGQERNKILHVWRLTPDTTVEMLSSHVKMMCGSEIIIRIEKIRHKTQRNYSSFIITLPEKYYDKLCQPEVWPVNVEFAEWVWFRRATNLPIDKV